MKIEITDKDHTAIEMAVKFSTDHPSSKNGCPVMLLDDDDAGREFILDQECYSLAGGRIIEADEDERALLEKWNKPTFFI